MDEQKITHKRNVGPEPVKARPNHDREKAYRASNPPKDVQDEKTKLPEGTTREKTEAEMPEAADEVRKRLDVRTDAS